MAIHSLKVRIRFFKWIASVASLPRNDDKKVDSRNAPNLNKQAKDSRICDEKVGLRSLLRGDKADRLSHKQKASSLLYRAKPNPKAKDNAQS